MVTGTERTPITRYCHLLASQARHSRLGRSRGPLVGLDIRDYLSRGPPKPSLTIPNAASRGDLLVESGLALRTLTVLLSGLVGRL
jgi:hypothetical protein